MPSSIKLANSLAQHLLCGLVRHGFSVLLVLADAHLIWNLSLIVFEISRFIPRIVRLFAGLHDLSDDCRVVKIGLRSRNFEILAAINGLGFLETFDAASVAVGEVWFNKLLK